MTPRLSESSSVKKNSGRYLRTLLCLATAATATVLCGPEAAVGEHSSLTFTATYQFWVLPWHFSAGCLHSSAADGSFLWRWGWNPRPEGKHPPIKLHPQPLDLLLFWMTLYWGWYRMFSISGIAEHPPWWGRSLGRALALQVFFH